MVFSKKEIGYKSSKCSIIYVKSYKKTHKNKNNLKQFLIKKHTNIDSFIT